MKTLKFRLFVFGCILAGLHAQAWSATSLPYNQPTTGSITSAGQNVSFTFTASAKDVLNATVVTTKSTSGTFGPCIELYDPTLTLVDQAGGSFSQAVEMNLYPVTSTGTYTALIKDCADTATGNFTVFLQKSDAPIGSVPLVYNTTKTGVIASPAQSNAYTLSATINDVLNFTVVTTKSTSGTYGPCISIYNTTGTVPLDSAGGSYAQAVEMNLYKVPATGTYNIFVKDCADTATGNYTLFVQKTNKPIGSVPGLYDEVQTGTITSPSQSNSYTLIGTKNDLLNFTVVATKSNSGTFGPCISIYNSTGTAPLDSAGGSYSQTVEMNGYKIPANGTYNVFIKDCADTATGNYTIGAECLGVCALPAPVLTSISPTNVKVNSPGFTLTVNGSNFVNVAANSVVEWNGAPLNTTFVSTTQLKAAVPATPNLATTGCFPITVFTPPGTNGNGGTSKPVQFCVNGPTATPVFTPGAGTYTTPQQVSVSDATPGAVIYCAINGTPTISAADICTSPIAVNVTESITAIAAAPGFTQSSAITALYTIEQPCTAPVFSPAAGTYTSEQTVTMTTTCPGAAIHYTTNSTTPTTSSPLYSGPITISVSTSFAAIAVAPGYSTSVVSKASYHLIGTPSALSAQASNITASTATLNAAVNTLGLAGSYYFQYGTSMNALSTTTPTTTLKAVSQVIPASAQLNGLTTKTTYYFQVVVTTAGGTSFGAILHFPTN